jgi:hypothetical protein
MQVGRSRSPRGTLARGVRTGEGHVDCGMIEGWRKVPYSIQSFILELEVHFHVLRSTFNTWSAVELEYGNVYDLHLHGTSARKIQLI